MINDKIFIGPPGTGKTFKAKYSAICIIWEYLQENSVDLGNKTRYYDPNNFCEDSFNYVQNHFLSDNGNSLIKLISMHDGMTSSDLLFGISLQTTNGHTSFQNIEKTVVELISILNNEDKVAILILDDINRVDTSNVLGELLYAFSHKGDEITLSNGKRISVPHNLHIFMTMNEVFPMFNLDISLVNTFELEYLRNNEMQLIKSINNWIFKYYYFTCLSDEDINIIIKSKKLIIEKLDEMRNDGNIIKDEFLKLLKIDINSYFNEQNLDILEYCVQTNENSHYFCEDDIKKPRKYRDVIQAANLIFTIYKKYYSQYKATSIHANSLKVSALSEWQKYNNFISSRISIDYRAQIDLFHLGMAYFLPHNNVSLYEAKSMIIHQIRGQVIPLIKQYIYDGILENGDIPSYDVTSTRYQLTDMFDDKILINKKYKYADQFDKGIRNGSFDDLRNPENRSHRYNPHYSLVFSIIETIVNSHLISYWQLMDLLCNDFNIIRKQSNDSIHHYDGGLLAEKSIAATILAGDNARGNETLKAYTESLHKFKYKGKEYLLFSKYSFPRRNLNYSTEECREKEITLNRRDSYLIVKVLIYDYFLQYKSNINGYLNENDQINSSIKNELASTASKIDQTLLKIDSIEWHGDDINERLCNLYKDITSLDLWKDMKNRNLKGVYMGLNNNYQAIMDATGIHQIILQGPPGTSKTYGAKKFLAEKLNIVDTDGKWKQEILEKNRLISKDDKYELPDTSTNLFWDIIQFHPSYTYEDFVRGITVKTKNKDSKLKGRLFSNDSNSNYEIELDNSSSLYYDTVNKVLGKIAQIAQENPNNNFYLIIDEINRANLATVFGELIYALEYRDGKGVSTPYIVNGSPNIIVPNNLYIIGTMNTADKSIASIDYAIRRRFLFFPILPNIVTVYDNVEKNIDSIELKLFYLTEKYFDAYYNKDDYNIDDIKIGHTFFLRKQMCGQDNDFQNQMKLRFIYQVLPVMKEYLNDGILTNERNVDAFSENESDTLDEYLTTFEKLLKTSDYSKVEKLYNDFLSILNTNNSALNSLIKSEIESRNNSD
ncbi:AAA domain-containing protein [Holdemanella biformis]|uniref:AAA domain-containing protein n=1 Tax=Holdemanella porci TaxID=2652276 RepID=A0A6N7VGR7_9FIRM|nr:AAA family ATPase [Holdemanella porci]MSS56228.1 AAA domain-containing protein [Holdemanella porci]